jgi:hypothetical protein
MSPIQKMCALASTADIHQGTAKPEVFKAWVMLRSSVDVDPATVYHRRAVPCARIKQLVTCRSQ